MEGEFFSDEQSGFYKRFWDYLREIHLTIVLYIYIYIYNELVKTSFSCN